MSGHQRTHVTRAFLAGSFAFTVECKTASLRDTVEALFMDLEQPPPQPPRHTLKLEEVEQDGKPMLALSGSGDYDTVPMEADYALDVLVSRVARLSLDADPDRLHLHAAALARDGHGLLISAPGGTGKSTLAVALARRGWEYLTDEMVAVTPGDAAVGGFTKSLTVKYTGRELFPDLEDRRVALGASSGTWWHVPASRLGARPIRSSAPALTVFLTRSEGGSAAGAQPSWEPVRAADAVVMLVQQSMDVGRFGPSALELIADLAGRCRSVRVDVATPANTAELVERLLEEAVESTRTVPIMLRRDGPSEYATGVNVGASVVSVLLENRVVVHDVSSGKIASFDEAGSAVWSALFGRFPAGQALPEPDSVGVRSFFRALAGEEFVTLDDEAVATGPRDVS